MNENSLSRLYRRMTGTAPAVSIDASDLAAVVDGDAGLSAERRSAVVAALASSADHADVARMLGALKPESAALAAQVGAMTRVSHPMRSRELRPAAGRRSAPRPLRWAGGVAACLAVAVAIGTWHGRPADENDVATAPSSAASSAKQDRIFTTRDRIFVSSDQGDRGSRGGHGGDALFHGDFSG